MQNKLISSSELTLLNEIELQQTTGGSDDVLVPIDIYFPRPFPPIKFPPIKLPKPVPFPLPGPLPINPVLL